MSECLGSGRFNVEFSPNGKCSRWRSGIMTVDQVKRRKSRHPPFSHTEFVKIQTLSLVNT